MANGGGQAIGPAEGRVMAGATTDPVGAGETGIEEQHLSQLGACCGNAVVVAAVPRQVINSTLRAMRVSVECVFMRSPLSFSLIIFLPAIDAE